MNFDEAGWEKKIVKIYKALSIMEKVKYLEPHLSKTFSDLASFLSLSNVLFNSAMMNQFRKVNMVQEECPCQD